nr:prepilin peptidase [Corynebacterium mycetoides]
MRYDLSRQRLPDVLTVPAALVAAAACLVWPAGLMGWVWPVAYLLGGRGVGGGDIKLAASLGVWCAVAGGLAAVLVAIVLASVFTLAAAAALRKRALAHGPSMLAAAWIVALYGLWGAGL